MRGEVRYSNSSEHDSAVEASGKHLVFLGKSLVHHFGKNLVAAVS